MTKIARFSSCFAVLCALGVMHKSAQASEACSTVEHCHDGLYLRIGSGFAAYSEALTSDANNDAGRDPEASITGIGTAGELALGGTVARGFVLGGGIYGTSVLAYTVNIENGETAPPELLRPNWLLLVGPFVDWYVWPHRGLHLQGALGFAMEFGDEPGHSETNLRKPALGAGLTLGIGYEVWIGDEWSLGALWRLGIASLRDKDEGGKKFTHVAVTAPALLVTVTHH